MAGIRRAKAEGKYKGRKPIQIDWDKFKEVYAKVERGECTNLWAMKELDLKRNTYYKFVAKYKYEKESS